MTWRIAIKGEDTYKKLDANNEITLAELDTTDPADDPNWVVFEIIGASPEYKEDNETIEVPGGYEIQRSTQRLTLKCQVVSVAFPDEMDIFVTYKTLKKFRYKYFYNIDYPDTQMPLHSAGNAVCVNITKTVEHNYDSGTKTMTLEINKIGIE